MQLIAWISMVYLGLTFGLSFSIVKIVLMEINSPIVILFWQSCFSSFLLTYLTERTIDHSITR